MKEKRSNWRVVGGAYVLPNTLLANHTHLTSYTRTVSLHRVSARLVSLVQNAGNDPASQPWQGRIFPLDQFCVVRMPGNDPSPSVWKTEVQPITPHSRELLTQERGPNTAEQQDLRTRRKANQ
jgi:hypothetical protein